MKGIAEKKFLRGTLVLMAASVVLKAMGFVYQVIIVRTIGTEAIGIVNMAMPIYAAVMVCATMGLPLAISRMVSREHARGHHDHVAKTMQTAFVMVFFSAAIFSLGALVFAPKLFAWSGADRRLRWCFYVMIPGIVIVPICSVMRGYFQGRQLVEYPAMAQIIEQAVRIAVGLAWIRMIRNEDAIYGAMVLSAAMMIGEVAGCVVLWAFYRRKKFPRCSSGYGQRRNIATELISLGIPTSLTKLTSSVDMIIEAWLVPWCFCAIGMNHNQAADCYGQLCGVAISILSVPNILTGALATMLVPSIAELSVKKGEQLAKKCANAWALTYMTGLPIAVVAWEKGEKLVRLIYAIDGLGSVVAALALGAVFIYLGQITVGILQGLGKNRAVFVHNFLGSALKLSAMYWFAFGEKMGLLGAALGISFGYAAQCMLNMTALYCAVEMPKNPRAIIIPALAAGSMTAVMDKLDGYFSAWLGDIAGLAATIGICALGYIAILFTTGQLRREMLQ